MGNSVKPLSAFFNLISQFIPLLLTFALAATSYWFAIQSELSLFSASGKSDPTSSDYYLRNFSVQSHDLAENKYSIIRSNAAEHIPQGNVWNITAPELEQFESGNGMVKGNAQKGVYLLDTDEIFLRDNVVVTSQNEGLLTTMKSEEIRIDNITNEISTDKNVLVTRPGQRFEAQGATLNNDTGELTAQGSIKFRIEAKR
ncbi:LPS export ABC transporter periplasmic protein LptC [Limnobacter sp.]|jgi:LPS export ABC transporter protein LptC|uniref:LPS export ABC transporter periplasmic protein LptC n=1 Tax=Limnobacter sp. TaxID=2003368 RepID=UPI0025BC8B5D|nr:LPS export ABC transporter periplasmic protein LptC [Limnobacter sp.]